ncbi:MAG: AbrB family transcriptional regulator [Defluviitaleaceae bacterium]|nr:AbrB family transcriptional regulator [Defluviitaleaceae bacterium]
MAYLILLHIVGFTGGLLVKKSKKVPAGMLLGSLVSVVLLNLATGYDYEYPMNLRLVIQVFAGAFIGLSFTRADVFRLRILFKPVIILIAMLTAINVLFAMLISNFTTLDYFTALFASAPAGVSDMTLIAQDFGANPQQVALLQIFRFAFVVAFFPFLIRRIVPKETPQDLTSSAPEIAIPEQQATRVKKVPRLILTIVTAAAGAMIARFFGIPAGTLIGALTATVLLNTIFQTAYIPPNVRVFIQGFAGCFIGSQITLATISQLQFLLLPVAFITVQLIIMTFLTAWVLQRFSPLDRATCLVSCVPGGLLEMGILAQDLGLRVPEVIFLHTCRVIAVVSIMPVLLFALTRAF